MMTGKPTLRIAHRYTEHQREHLREWGRFVDSQLDGILRQDWEARE